MAFAGPALVQEQGGHQDGVGGRHGVGGGGAWRRGGLRPDSHMVGAGIGFQRHDMGPQVDEGERANPLWQGRGVGRGPVWVEGGPFGKAGFRENAGWTGSFAKGEKPQAAEREQRGAAGKEEPAPAPDAKALLQVFRSLEAAREEIEVRHRFTIGREDGCDLKLQWDGMSRRHAFLEAFHVGGRQTPPGGAKLARAGAARREIQWFVIPAGGNGTFLNNKRLENGSYVAIADGDVLGFGKGRDKQAGSSMPEKDLVYMFVFRRPKPSGQSVGFQRAATAGCLNDGVDADPHAVPQGEVNHPCKSATFPPSNYKPSAEDEKGPASSLQLDFVYGYSSGGMEGAGARQNLHYLIDGRIVYPAGTLGVVYDGRSHTQEFFREHDAPVCCLALHPNKRIVASGQFASTHRPTPENRPSAAVIVWDAVARPPRRLVKPLARLLEHRVHALSFTTSGQKLVAFGGDIKNMCRVAIYEWAKATGPSGYIEGSDTLGLWPIADGKAFTPAGGQSTWLVSHNPYVADRPLPADVAEAQERVYAERTEFALGTVQEPKGGLPEVREDGFDMVQCVDQAIKLWNYRKFYHDPNRAARIMLGVTNPQKALSVAWCPPSWFAEAPATVVPAVGLELGDIFFFQQVGPKVTVTFKIEGAHRGEVLCLKFVVLRPPGTDSSSDVGEQYLFSGGRDGVVKAWDPRLSWSEPAFVVDVKEYADDGTEGVLAVRSLDFDPQRGLLIAGTSTNCIVEVDLDKLRKGAAGQGRVVFSSHFSSVCGLAPLNEGGGFITTGTDRTLRFYDCLARHHFACRHMGVAGVALDVSPDSRLIAVGHPNGQFSVWESLRLQCLYYNEHSRSDVHLLKFSPDSLLLAVVADKRSIHLYDCTRYAVKAPPGQSAQYYGDGRGKKKHDADRGKRQKFMLANHASARSSAGVRSTQVGSKLNPEPHAKHLIRPAPTGGVAHKVGAAQPAGSLQPQLPAFKLVAASARHHTATITSFDFSADGKLMRSADATGELLHWNVPSMTPHPRAHELRDVRWHSYSVPLAWELKSVWAKGSKRAPLDEVRHSDVSPDRAAAVVALNGRTVALFKFPSVGKFPGRQVYHGHGSDVAAARFTPDNRFAISIGTTDLCTFQWRHVTSRDDDRGGHGTLRRVPDEHRRPGLAPPSTFKIVTRADSDD